MHFICGMDKGISTEFSADKLPANYYENLFHWCFNRVFHDRQIWQKQQQGVEIHLKICQIWQIGSNAYHEKLESENKG